MEHLYKDELPDIKKIKEFLHTHTQSEALECFLEVVSILKINISTRALIDLMSYRLSEVGKIDVVNFLYELGYDTEIKQSSFLKTFKSFNVPLIHISFSSDKKTPHFNVIKEVMNDGNILCYSCEKKETYFQKLHMIPSGEILLLKKIAEKTLSNEEKKAYAYDFYSLFIKNSKLRILKIFMLNFLAGILGSFFPFFIIIGSGVALSGVIETINSFSLIIVSIILLSLFINQIKINLYALSISKIDFQISTKLFQQIITLPKKYSIKSNMSGQVTKMEYLKSIYGMLKSSPILSLMDLPIHLVFLGVVLYISTKLFVLNLLIVFIFFLYALFVKKQYNFIGDSSEKKDSAYRRSLLEMLSRVQNIEEEGLIKNTINHYEINIRKILSSNLQYSLDKKLTSDFGGFLYYFSGIILTCYGALLASSNEISKEYLAIYVIFSWKMLVPIKSIASGWYVLDLINKITKNINYLMQISTEEERGMQNKSFTIRSSIRFENVGFRFSNELPYVFSNLNFDIKENSLVAIVGASGSGNTTILRLINGIYEPTFGSIYLDNLHINQVNKIRLRQNIAYLPQMPAFFAGTIEENFRYSKKRS